MPGVELHRGWWSVETEFSTRLAIAGNLSHWWSKPYAIFKMEQLYLCLASTALFTSILVSFWSFTAWGQVGRTFQEFFLSYHRKGLLSVLFPTAFLYHFRTRAELDKYLEASQIRERAIERINDVTGTYGLFSSFCLHFLSLVVSMFVLFWWLQSLCYAVDVVS